MSAAANGRDIQDTEQKLSSSVNSPLMGNPDHHLDEKQDIEVDRPRKSEIMPSIRQFLLTLMIVSLLTMTIVSAATSNRSPGNASPCMGDQKAFRELLDTVEPAMLHEVLHQHMGEKYQHGVYEDDKEAMEAVYRQEPGVAHALVEATKADALLELAKRASNSTSNEAPGTTSSTAGTSESVAPSASSSSASVSPSSTAAASTSASVTRSPTSSDATPTVPPTTAPSSTADRTPEPSSTQTVTNDRTTPTPTNSGTSKSESSSHSFSSTSTSAFTLPTFFLVNSTFSASFPTIIPHDSSISTVGLHPTMAVPLGSSSKVSSAILIPASSKAPAAILISASSPVSLGGFPVILNAVISSSSSLGYPSRTVSGFGPSSVGYHTLSSISVSGLGSGNLGNSLALVSTSSLVGYDNISPVVLLSVSTSIGSHHSFATSVSSSSINLPSYAFSSSFSGLDLYSHSGSTSTTTSQITPSASEASSSASQASESSSGTTSVPVATGTSTSEASISSGEFTSQATASGATTSSGASSSSIEASSSNTLTTLTTSAGSPSTESSYTMVVTLTSTNLVETTVSFTDTSSTQAPVETGKRTTSQTSTQTFTTTLPNGSLSTVTAITIVPGVITGGSEGGSTRTSTGKASLQTNSAEKNTLGINLALGAFGMAVVGAL
ncbi:hypothetical protein DSL72_008717 [Monilinia vaccinii-corymbosi]|uniref:Uncharacterized protein n=1 Tax=Monilinia vaccinii-corymbosi TaxID=61207 RepID=A0A8A3PQ78_9HELO|nr:hypothetical protein DSL72_008717 [Monilinia vaccinii-corymbosi]